MLPPAKTTPTTKLSDTTISQGDLIEGLAQLATNGMVEITELVEAIHKEIVLKPLVYIAPNLVSTWHNQTTSRIYDMIKTIMRFSGENLAHSIRLLNQQLNTYQQQKTLPDNLKRIANIINGVMGDHLVTHHNPIANPMCFYDRYGEVYHPKNKLKGRVVVLVHGLCLSYLSWNPGEDIGMGEHIAYAQPNTTILYLDYNTGKRISRNGHLLSILMQQLIDNNPDITHVDFIGHSMGGLVSRSAIFYAKQECATWLNKLDHYISLASPHHGAVLERIGFFLQENLAKIPIAGNLSHLLDIRSAGIIDLRHGSVRDDDWEQLQARMGFSDDIRHPAPMPSSVNAYLIAACLDEKPSKNSFDLIGDGLVSISSALGEHAGDHHINIPEARKAIFYGVNHMDIQYHERVRDLVIQWLGESHDEKARNFQKGQRVISLPRTPKKYKIAS